MSGTTIPTRSQRSEHRSRLNTSRLHAAWSPQSKPLSTETSLRTPWRTGKTWSALQKFSLQLLPTVPEKSSGYGQRRNQQHQHGGRHVARPKATPTRPLGPAPTLSMRIDTESGKRAPGTITPSMLLERLCLFSNQKSKKERAGRGKRNETGFSAHVRGCALVLRVKMAERGYSFSLTTFRYGRDSRGPPRNRGCRSSADQVFTFLVSDLALPEGLVGNGGGNASLPSHLRGLPAAWGALVPRDRGNASQGILGDLGAVGSWGPYPGIFFRFGTREKGNFEWAASRFPVQNSFFLTQVGLIQELLEVGILVSPVGFLFLGKTQLYSSVLVLASIWR